MTRDLDSAFGAAELEALLAFDRTHVYHPYTSMADPLPVYGVRRADGVYLELMDGRRLVDGMSSWWSVLHGYNHPRLNAALQEQLGQMAHVMFGGLTHRPAVDLARVLVERAPGDLSRVFFCDSGSVAVEVAMKMALQFAMAQGEPARKRFISLRGGYHGDTFGAMSVCDPVTGMHHLFQGALAEQLFVERPRCALGQGVTVEAVAPLRELLESRGHEVAAVILEPVVQGAGGMYFYEPEYLRHVRQLCDAHGVLWIADEIATGFGRTGKWFACEHAGVTPDILCLGKGLTGGYMTLAATVTTSRVSEGIGQGPAGGTFMHGPTFMANPLACAVALASLELLATYPLAELTDQIAATLRAGLQSCVAEPSVQEVRVLGAIGVVEMREPVPMVEAQQSFVADGAWIRPFGKLVYVMPPLTSNAAELGVLTHAMCNFVQKRSAALG